MGLSWQIFEDLEATPGLQPEMLSYNQTILAYGRLGQWENALGVFNTMKESEHTQPDEMTYNYLIGQCGRRREWQVCEPHIDRVAVSTMRGELGDVCVENIRIHGLLHCDDSIARVMGLRRLGLRRRAVQLWLWRGCVRFCTMLESRADRISPN